MKVRDLIKRIEGDGWCQVRTRSSHDAENHKFGFIRDGAFDGKNLLLDLLNQFQNPRVTLKLEPPFGRRM